MLDKAYYSAYLVVLYSDWRDIELSREMCWNVSAVSNVDTSGVSLFRELRQAMKNKDVEARMLNLLYFFRGFTTLCTCDKNQLLKLSMWQIVLVNPLADVMEKLKKADGGKNELIRADYLFLTVGEAVASLSPTTKYKASNMEEGTQDSPHFW